MRPLPSKTGLPHLDLASWEKGFSHGFRGNVWWPGPGTEPLSYTAGYQEATVRNSRIEPDAGVEPRPTPPSPMAGGPVMAADERRLLELLAERADGATDALLAGCDFSLDLMVGLVQAGLATTTGERTFVAGKPVEISRMRITEAGRERLRPANYETGLRHGGLSGGPGQMPSRAKPAPGAGRRALELLASFPDGCTEFEMRAHGVAPKIIAGLTKGGFAKADSPHGGQQLIRLKITDAGRRVLVERR